MIKKITFILLFLFAVQIVFAQKTAIKINVKNKALNAVLVELRDNYDFQFSYSDNQLAKHKITLSETFYSKDEAIERLLSDLPLKLKKTGDVYIIIPDKKKEKKETKEKLQTKITGQIVEAGSYEPLPFSHILINNHQLVSDVMGSFNFIASTDSSFHLRISHLGYYVYDTVLFAGINQKFTLTPSNENIAEITVINNIIEKATLIGEKPGKIKLNHNISRFLPGQGDNSVFNLLRLMPGIQAAGEQSTDLLIWGSYEGQSQITFDEFTVFGLKNYNDNISVVNPFLVKNIEIYKGGFESKYGNRVGGIVNISGKNGNTQKPSFSLNINATTVNGLVEIPIFNKSSLMLAYRQTYYNLYKSTDFNIFAPTRPINKIGSGNMNAKNFEFDFDVYPDNYQFKDLNLKYSAQLANSDQFYISAYRGGDIFDLTANSNISRQTRGNNGQFKQTPIELTFLNEEINKQRGLTVFYGKNWINGSSSKVILSHSLFSKTVTDSTSSINLSNNNILKLDRLNITNTAVENELKIQNSIPLSNGNQFEFGGGLIVNKATIATTTKFLDLLINDTINSFNNNRAYIYLQNNFNIGRNLSIKTGVRLNYHRGINNYFLEPRFSASYQLAKALKFNASWGIYNQFMFKVTNIDRDNNYTYVWLTANEKTHALRAQHSIAGFNYFKNDLTINIEGYYKTTTNIIQRIYETKIRGTEEISKYFTYVGSAKTMGIDTYIKKDFGNHSIWASYTLSKIMERLALPGSLLPLYEPAAHDQRHEFKIAGLFKIKNFFISGNYVYGSGMKIVKDVFENLDDVSYNRVDAALTYKFSTKRFNAETGLSILNIFDSQNLKYANIKNIKINQDIGSIKVYSDAVPLTPILFLKMVF